MQFAYNSAKAAASHLTKMMATEFALKKVPVRVCAVAPGVWESEMTFDSITDDLVDKVSKAVVPVPTRRSGKYVPVTLRSRACADSGRAFIW